MKRIWLYTICLGLVGLFACQQEELPYNNNVGYLSLENISIQSADVETITTRAVDTDLYVEIWDEEGTSQVGETYGPGNIAKIELEPGYYMLKAYNAAFLDQSSWTENDKGAAVYYADQLFSIEAGKVNYLSVDVPMINWGVQLDLPQNFADWFDGENYTFTVKIGEKTVELKDEEIAYFSHSSDVKLSYKLIATNKDGERFESEEIIYDKALSPGTIYVITYDYETQSLQLSNALTQQP